MKISGSQPVGHPPSRNRARVILHSIADEQCGGVLACRAEVHSIHIYLPFMEAERSGCAAHAYVRADVQVALAILRGLPGQFECVPASIRVGRMCGAATTLCGYVGVSSSQRLTE